MIARIWRGRVSLEKADEYEEFLVVSYWDSLESIKEFAGEGYEEAKYYPKDKDYLIEFEPYVTHYRVTYKD